MEDVDAQEGWREVGAWGRPADRCLPFCFGDLLKNGLGGTRVCVGRRLLPSFVFEFLERIVLMNTLSWQVNMF